MWLVWSFSKADLTFAGSDEHNDKFHHWQQGQDAGVAIQLEDPKLFWCQIGKCMSDLSVRQVWDGGHIVANIKPEVMETVVGHPLF